MYEGNFYHYVRDWEKGPCRILSQSTCPSLLRYCFTILGCHTPFGIIATLVDTCFCIPILLLLYSLCAVAIHGRSCYRWMRIHCYDIIVYQWILSCMEYIGTIIATLLNFKLKLIECSDSSFQTNIHHFLS